MKLEKTFQVILGISLFVIIWGIVRPGNQQQTGISTFDFILNKMERKHDVNVVFVGDSRTETNIAPTVIQEILPDVGKIFNAGFSAQSLSERYFDHCAQMLISDSTAPQPLFILGISHDSNLGMEGENGPSISEFERFELRNYTAYRRWENWLVTDFCAPIRISELCKLIQPSYQPAKSAENHLDGWKAISIADHTKIYEMDGIAMHARKVVPGKILNDSQQKGLVFLTKKIKELRASGIIVIAYQPPTSEENIRKTANYFLKTEFVRRTLQNAGAIWLEVPYTRYYSYDNSHLEKQAALQFSHDLATMLKEKKDAGLLDQLR